MIYSPKVFLLLTLTLMCNFVFSSVPETEKPYVFKSKEDHLVKLLNVGSSSFYERIELIRKAKKSIVLEYFIFNHDLSGKIMTDELLKKVKEGVEVQILLDDFTIASEITPHHSAELLRRGIKLKYYNTAPLYQAVEANYRNHRKLFIVDDYHYIVGGRNIGDDYFDLSERYNFVDRDVLFSGPSAKIVRKSFDAFFNSKHSEKKFRPPMPTLSQLAFLRSSQSQKSRLLQKVRAERRIWSERKSKGRKFFKFSKTEKKRVNKLMSIGKETINWEYQGKCNNLEFVSDLPLTGPENDYKRVARYYIYKYLKEAKSKIVIDSPYFILNDELIEIIGNQLSENVDVILLTNGIYSSDALPVSAVFNHYLDSWVSRGLVPSIYSGKKLFDDKYYVSKKVAGSRWGTHSKTLSIDNELSVIGSYNFDPRSAVYSVELMVACYGNPELAKAIEANINLRRDNGIIFNDAKDVRDHEFYNVSLFKKMGYYLIKPFSLLLQGLL